MSGRKLKQLAARLALAENAQEYFTLLFTLMGGLPRYGVVFREDRPVRVVFFGEHFDTEVARMILECPKSREIFAGTEELRVISTEIDRAVAEQFRKFNPQMKIIFRTVEEWVTRPIGSVNPAAIIEDLPPDFQ